MSRIEPILSDRFVIGTQPVLYAGTKWMREIAQRLNPRTGIKDLDIVIQSPGVQFASLFEWVTFVSWADKVLDTPFIRSVQIDFTNSPQCRILNPPDLVEFKRHKHIPLLYTERDCEFTDRLMSLMNFVEGIGTRSVLNRANRTSRFFYTGMTEEMLALRTWYTGSDHSHILFGLTRIHSKDDCGQFLDERSILAWRENMEAKYYQSPLFRFDELWRVICHELSVNCWEHSGGSGFLSARIFSPTSRAGALRPLSQMSCGGIVQRELAEMGDVLELCISDYGSGMTATLSEAYAARSGISRPLDASNILAFAFDEFGTSKDRSESWATSRHALGRLLWIVQKYGGSLVMRSDGTEITYVGGHERFTRIPNHLGFEPTHRETTTPSLLGTQLQILLPLEPRHRVEVARAKPILNEALPKSYRIDEKQVRGHLVPVLERLNLDPSTPGASGARTFRPACERLCSELADRPIAEPLVFDLHDVKWTSAQLETFLYLFQNILQTRPILLVQIDSNLAIQMNEFEDANRETLLDPQDLFSNLGGSETLYDRLSESHFLETYRGIHCPVLALDSEGKCYLFGTPSPECRTVLLELIDSPPRTIEQMKTEVGTDLPGISAVLNGSSHLFQKVRDKWRCVWSPSDLELQARRTMQMQFDEVVKRTSAWRGRRTINQSNAGVINGRRAKLVIGEDSGKEKFNLPWQEEGAWVKEFLECSRILGRERYADEAAQLLVFRLRRFLQLRGISLSDVRVLAAVTAPAVELATAIRRWWPFREGFAKPIVVDLGYSLLLKAESDFPGMDSANGVVIIQDVLSAGIMSGRLIELLRKKQINVIGLLALVRLTEQETTHATSPSDWTIINGIPAHAMVEVKRPEACPAPSPQDPDSRHFWIEPRTLRPFQYNALRGASRSVHATSTHGGPNPLETENTSLVRAGHFVVGYRHLSIAADIPGTLSGPIGDELAAWIADICEGNTSRPKAKWESRRGHTKFKGDVTAVLMPINSQIHYLWPKVERLLHQRGCRPIPLFLDATLFIGSGPAYRFPLPFKQQVYDAVFDLNRRAEQPTGEHIRVLILDDAIATSRTILSVLDAVQRTIRRAFADYGVPPTNATSPIEWIRYFAVFNRMTHTQDHYWSAMTHTPGEFQISFIFEHYVRCMGFPPPDESSCPLCNELRSLRVLRSENVRARNEIVGAWLEVREKELRPIEMTSPGVSGTPPNRLTEPIFVLPPQGEFAERGPAEFEAHYADTAIALFYELMYRSYPPADVFMSLRRFHRPFPSGSDDSELKRYRWAVLEWGLRNWPRIIATGSRRAYFECAWLEVEHNTGIMESLFYSLGALNDFESGSPLQSIDITQGGSSFAHISLESFIVAAIRDLRRMESGRFFENAGVDRSERVVRLNLALNLFFLRLSSEGPLKAERDGEEFLQRLIGQLQTEVNSQDDRDLTFTRQLFLRWGKNRNSIGVAWPLYVIAESLFRGDDGKGRASNSNHTLLRGWLRNVLDFPDDQEFRALLQGSLGSFLAALEDLRPYFAVEVLSEQSGFVKHALIVMEWLGSPINSEQRVTAIDELSFCLQDLEDGQPLPENIRRMFHPSVEEIGKQLETQARHNAADLDFGYEIDPEAAGERALILKERLCFTLLNWTAGAINDYPTGQYRCRVRVSRAKDANMRSRIRFRILSNYVDYAEAEENVKQGRSWAATIETIMKPFDVEVSPWKKPLEPELAEGFLAACDLMVPTGFLRKEKR